MVTVERYDIVASEVLAVLNVTDPEVKARIPRELIAKLEEIADKNHKVEINPNKSLEDQNLNPMTLDYITGIYYKYLGTDLEKNEFNDRLRFQKEAEEARKKQSIRDYNEMFDRPKEEPIEKKEEKPEENNKLVVVKEPNIFKKLWNKIISIFKK